MKRTPLRRTSGLKTSKRTTRKDRREAAERIARAELRRTKGLPAVSAKKRAMRRQEAEVREATFARDGWRCQFPHDLFRQVPCFGGLTFHHLRKSSQGGAYAVENGLTLCAVSNGWIETAVGPDLDSLRFLGFVVRTEDAS